MKVLVNSPVDLSEWISRNSEKLRGKRSFYVVEPRMEQGDSIKFGIAGLSSGNSYHRLSEYRILYGETSSNSNSCKGVILHWLGTVDYNRLVQPEKTVVFLMEKKMKQKFRSYTEAGRGTERIPKSALGELLSELNSNDWPVEQETVLRTTNRKSSQKYHYDRAAFKGQTSGVRTRAQTS